MTRLRKKFVLMFALILVVLVMLLVEPCAAPITVPVNPSSAPEVSVEHFENSDYRNGSIVITIKNRPFSPYTDKDGHTINVYYTFLRQGQLIHPGSLSTIPPPPIDWGYFYNAMPHRSPYAVYQSNSDYTIITITYGNNEYDYSSQFDKLGSINSGTVLYYRVQAVAGYFVRNNMYAVDVNAVFEGEGGDCVDIAVVIPSSFFSGESGVSISPTAAAPSISNSDNPSPSDTNNILPTVDTPNSPSQTPWASYLLTIIITACIITIPIVIVICYNKHHQRKTKTHTNKPKHNQPN